ncbi:hypothetical protein AbraIFM66950_010110 [Aspergillus brasiliensis]|nr:hypothetical protein AbraIFM66950_010110 [Aspergillus brasiliensis]
MARQALDNFYEHVMRIRDSVPEDGHMDLHDLDNVEHVLNFDFEHLDEKADPPLYFEPMQQAELKEFPPNPAQVRHFFNITDWENIGFPRSIPGCYRQTSSLISDYATRKAVSHQHLQIVVAPDSSLYLEAGCLAWFYGKRGWWQVCYVLEPEPEPVNGKDYPHLALHLLDEKVAREDSILYSEFSALVIAMRGRAHQPRINSESELEELYEREDAGEDYRAILPQPWPLMFPDEECFPVLLISCSKLYSFEWRDKAPVELFTRLFLSSPVDTQPRGETTDLCSKLAAL